MSERHLYVPVRVTIRDGVAVSAEVDPEGAPYSYAGEGEECYDTGAGKWFFPSGEERAAAERFLDDRLEGKKDEAPC